MNISPTGGQTTPGRHGRPVPPPASPNAAPDESGRDEVSGYGGASLVGSNVSGLDAARSSDPGTTHAAPPRSESDADDGATSVHDTESSASVAGGGRTHTPAGVSTIGSGTTGLNNYSPGSDLGAGLLRAPDAKKAPEDRRDA